MRLYVSLKFGLVSFVFLHQPQSALEQLDSKAQVRAANVRGRRVVGGSAQTSLKRGGGMRDEALYAHLLVLKLGTDKYAEIYGNYSELHYSLAIIFSRSVRLV
mmetsp:Transcript_27401/g.61912  ORF Transcript_27401/g.61912 Transcript_27401/m.61912 type:complete len:103 (+) Transcript_27401:75-383(+)